MLIGELAERAGTTAKTLRFYEDAGLLDDPGRTGSGYRDYPPDALERIGFIRDAQTAGFTLRRSARFSISATAVRRPAHTSASSSIYGSTTSTNASSSSSRPRHTSSSSRDEPANSTPRTAAATARSSRARRTDGPIEDRGQSRVPSVMKSCY